MKTITLTQGKVALVDDADFERVTMHSWSVDAYGYAQARANGTTIKMHRLILGCPGDVDHKNGARTDNRRENLRPCNDRENQGNRIKSSGHNGRQCHSQYKGVTRKRNSRSRPWQAQIGKHGTIVYLGTFATEQEAALKYDEAARDYFGDFALLNFPGGALGASASSMSTE